MKTKCFIPFVLGLVTMLSLASCQTTSSSGGPTEAVACAKCQMVAYERVGTMNKQITVLRGETMSCPDCESTARNYFSKGMSLKHACPSCGSQLMHCRAH